LENTKYACRHILIGASALGNTIGVLDELDGVILFELDESMCKLQRKYVISSKQAPFSCFEFIDENTVVCGNRSGHVIVSRRPVDSPRYDMLFKTSVGEFCTRIRRMESSKSFIVSTLNGAFYTFLHIQDSQTATLLKALEGKFASNSSLATIPKSDPFAAHLDNNSDNLVIIDRILELLHLSEPEVKEALQGLNIQEVLNTVCLVNMDLNFV
jgi:hypothetical protein